LRLPLSFQLQPGSPRRRSGPAAGRGDRVR
jgi:hypothetical protein